MVIIIHLKNNYAFESLNLNVFITYKMITYQISIKFLYISSI